MPHLRRDGRHVRHNYVGNRLSVLVYIKHAINSYFQYYLDGMYSLDWTRPSISACTKAGNSPLDVSIRNG